MDPEESETGDETREDEDICTHGEIKRKQKKEIQRGVMRGRKIREKQVRENEDRMRFQEVGSDLDAIYPYVNDDNRLAQIDKEKGKVTGDVGDFLGTLEHSNKMKDGDAGKLTFLLDLKSQTTTLTVLTPITAAIKEIEKSIRENVEGKETLEDDELMRFSSLDNTLDEITLQFEQEMKIEDDIYERDRREMQLMDAERKMSERKTKEQLALDDVAEDVDFADVIFFDHLKGNETNFMHEQHIYQQEDEAMDSFSGYQLQLELSREQVNSDNEDANSISSDVGNLEVKPRQQLDPLKILKLGEDRLSLLGFIDHHISRNDKEKEKSGIETIQINSLMPWQNNNETMDFSDQHELEFVERKSSKEAKCQQPLEPIQTEHGQFVNPKNTKDKEQKQHSDMPKSILEEILRFDKRLNEAKQAIKIKKADHEKLESEAEAEYSTKRTSAIENCLSRELPQKVAAQKRAQLLRELQNKEADRHNKAEKIIAASISEYNSKIRKMRAEYEKTIFQLTKQLAQTEIPHTLGKVLTRYEQTLEDEKRKYAQKCKFDKLQDDQAAMQHFRQSRDLTQVHPYFASQHNEELRILKLREDSRQAQVLKKKKDASSAHSKHLTKIRQNRTRDIVAAWRKQYSEEGNNQSTRSINQYLQNAKPSQENKEIKLHPEITVNNSNSMASNMDTKSKQVTNTSYHSQNARRLPEDEQVRKKDQPRPQWNVLHELKRAYEQIEEDDDDYIKDEEEHDENIEQDIFPIKKQGRNTTRYHKKWRSFIGEAQSTTVCIHSLAKQRKSDTDEHTSKDTANKSSLFQSHHEQPNQHKAEECNNKALNNGSKGEPVFRNMETRTTRSSSKAMQGTTSVKNTVQQNCQRKRQHGSFDDAGTVTGKVIKCDMHENIGQHKECTELLMKNNSTQQPDHVEDNDLYCVAEQVNKQQDPPRAEHERNEEFDIMRKKAEQNNKMSLPVRKSIIEITRKLDHSQLGVEQRKRKHEGGPNLTKMPPEYGKRKQLTGTNVSTDSVIENQEKHRLNKATGEAVKELGYHLRRTSLNTIQIKQVNPCRSGKAITDEQITQLALRKSTIELTCKDDHNLITKQVNPSLPGKPVTGEQIRQLARKILNADCKVLKNKLKGRGTIAKAELQTIQGRKGTARKKMDQLRMENVRKMEGQGNQPDQWKREYSDHDKQLSIKQAQFKQRQEKLKAADRQAEANNERQKIEERMNDEKQRKSQQKLEDSRTDEEQNSRNESQWVTKGKQEEKAGKGQRKECRGWKAVTAEFEMKHCEAKEKRKSF